MLQRSVEFESLAASGTGGLSTAACCTHRCSEDRAGALANEAAIERQRHKPGVHPLLWEEMIEEALGNRRRALTLIQEAVSEGVAPAMILHTHVATGFSSMRDDPEFEAWLRARP